MLKLAYIDLQDYLNTLQDKHKELEKATKEVEQTLEENLILRKIRQNILKLNNNLIVMNVKSNRLKKIDEEGQVLNLAAALYIYNDHEVYYLSSGSNPKYNAYMELIVYNGK